ncbi:putative GATA transcription factor 22 [Phoenix dactylifera]|uniref:GATA transcription factor 22 n=1 Tax=Phoenix dactylifera TaxID=42345 RepID=A0A8B7CF27_PHODC|nr:putative GATA transcription factor 22 [Phoenix dactylifera]
MIPSNLNQSSLPLKKRNQDQSHLPTSTPTTNTSYPRPVFLETSIEDQGANCREPHGHQQQQQEKPNEFVLIDGSSDFLQSFSTNNDDKNDRRDQYVCDGYHHHEDGHGSVKWMPSKMRWMRKMLAWEQTVTSKPRSSMKNLEEKIQQNRDSIRNFPSGTIRVCSNCSTTKTPLWRSGPQGPKSLCNACGIRQRKARQAAMVVAAAGSGLVAMNTPSKVQKEKRTDRESTISNKKRCKINTTRTARKKLQIDDIMMSLSDDSAFHRVFPQDEKEAAILLMALSCGLIHG